MRRGVKPDDPAHNRALTMHAFAFILLLFSFVYAAPVTHLISTAGEVILTGVGRYT